MIAGRPVPFRRIVVITLGLGTAYAAGSLLAYNLFGASDIGVAYFPPAGITAAALLLLARRDWPWAILGFVCAEVAVDTWQGYELWRALGFALGNTLEPLVGATLLLTWSPLFDLRRRVDLSRFSLTMLGAGPLVGAAVGSLFLVRSEGYLSDVFHWWVGDALAVMTIGAPIIALARTGAWRDLRTPAEAVGLTVAAAGLSGLVFWRWEEPFVFLVGPLLLVAAFRYGLSGVAVGGAAAALVANVATATGRGPFAALEDLSPQEQLGLTQLFLAVVILSSWYFAAEIHERAIATDTSRAERSARSRAELLAHVGIALERDVGPQIRAQGVLDLVVPELADYGSIEWALDGEWQVLALAHRDPRSVSVLRQLREEHRLSDTVEGSVVRAVDDDQASVFGTIDDEVMDRFAVADRTRALLDELAPTSHVTMPLRGTAVPGALLVGRSADDRPAFTETEVALLQDIAWRTGLALENARLYESSRRVALELQHALLADSLVPVREAEVAACYQAGSDDLEVGGDWFETIDLGNGRIGMAVGDVVGRGLEAATTMGRLRTALAAMASTGDDPGRVLQQLNRFAGRVAGADCTSCCYAVLDLHEGTLQHASAGHPPLLIRRADGTAHFLEDGRSPLLGLSQGPRPSGTEWIGPGDAVILYSDGLVERRGEHLDDGLDRLAEAVIAAEAADPGRLCAEVLAAVVPPGGQRDDAVILCVVRQPDPAGTRRLSFPADPAELAEVRRVLRTWLEDTALPAEDREAALLAISEACANAVEHAYRGREGRVELVFEPTDDGMTVNVRDRGRWQPPSPVTDRGLGTTVMKAFSQGYDRRSDPHGTSVCLTFRPSESVG